MSLSTITELCSDEELEQLRTHVWEQRPEDAAPELFQQKAQQTNDEDLDVAYCWRVFSVRELASRYPYPLSSKIFELLQAGDRRDEGETSPQFPFLICRVQTVLVRFLAVLATQSYVQLTGAKDATCNRDVVQSLRSPTDQQWLGLATRVLSFINKWKKENESAPEATASFGNRNEIEALVQMLSEFFAQSGPLSANELEQYTPFTDKRTRKLLKNVQGSLKQVINYRDHLIHAAPYGDEDHQQHYNLLLACLMHLRPIAEREVLLKLGGEIWQLKGRVPTKVADVGDDEFWTNLPEKELVIVRGRNVVSSMSPLICVQQSLNDAAEFEEVFFLNTGMLDRLNYVGFTLAQHSDGRALGTYDQFKQYMAAIPTPPIPKETRFNFDDFALDKAKNFVGRGPLLKEIAAKTESCGGKVLLLRAHAGMGKSAVMAKLYERHNEPYVANQKKADRPTGDLWVFHFCMNNEGRNTPLAAYRSLVTQICQGLGVRNEKQHLSTDMNELKDKFLLLINGSEVQEKLAQRDGKRIVIAIDALDEGITNDEHSIPNCLPANLQEHVTVLASYRVNQEGSNRRVENQLQHISDEMIVDLEHANPLKGLTADDVRTFLELANGGEAPPESTYEATWTAASRDLNGEGADPFYLRFLLDASEKSLVTLSRAETIPESLDDAFEQMWISLPKDHSFLVHRMLLTLGIMRDFGDDELFAELFNRQNLTPEPISDQDIAALRIKTGKLLIYDGDRYTLFHDRFRTFLVGEQKDPIAEALAAEDL